MPMYLKKCKRQRWIVAFMGFLAFFNAYTLRICLSVAITKMTVKSSSFNKNSNNNNKSIDEETCPDHYADINNSNIFKNETTPAIRVHNSHQQPTGILFEWDEYMQGIILSSFYWGYAVSHLPGGLLASSRFGAKKTIGLGVLLTSLLTIATPKALKWGDAPALIALRFLMGLCEGVIQPGMSCLLARWIPAEERSMLGTFVYTGIRLGILVSSIASGLIIGRSTDNWPWIFYLFGGIGLLWYVFWELLCYDTPDKHPFITPEEKCHLNERLSVHINSSVSPPVPWKSVLTSRPLLALVAMQCGQDWCSYTIMSDLPKYMTGVLKLPVHLTGYASSMHNVSAWLFGMSMAWLSDRLVARERVTRTTVRKANTTISSAGPALFLLLAVNYAGCNVLLAVALITVGLTLSGSSLIGIKINVLDLSPNHAGVLMGLQNGVGAIAGILAPYTVGVLTPNQTLAEWRYVFLIVAGVYFVTTINFVINASGEVQPWNDESQAPDDVRVAENINEQMEEKIDLLAIKSNNREAFE